MINFVPFLAACLIYVAATGWFCSGLAPIKIIHSASLTDVNGAVTAAEPTDFNNAATEDA